MKRQPSLSVPGAGRAEKQWPIDRFAELARRIGSDALVVWGPGEEALARANEALEDDVRVLEEDGRDVKVRPFSRREVLPFLERFFFGR